MAHKIQIMFNLLGEFEFAATPPLIYKEFPVSQNVSAKEDKIILTSLVSPFDYILSYSLRSLLCPNIYFIYALPPFLDHTPPTLWRTSATLGFFLV